MLYQTIPTCSQWSRRRHVTLQYRGIILENSLLQGGRRKKGGGGQHLYWRVHIWMSTGVPYLTNPAACRSTVCEKWYAGVYCLHIRQTARVHTPDAGVHTRYVYKGSIQWGYTERIKGMHKGVHTGTHTRVQCHAPQAAMLSYALV